MGTPGALSLSRRDGGIEAMCGQELAVAKVPGEGRPALKQLNIGAEGAMTGWEVARGSMAHVGARSYGSGRGTRGIGRTPSNPTRGQARGLKTPSLVSIDHNKH